MRHPSRDPFPRLVEQALEAIPADFRAHLERVRLEVMDWPEPELLASLGLDPGEELYGVYVGTPLTERGADPGLLPDRILIFRGPLEADFPDPDQLAEEIAITVMHEVAHAFGIGEERLEELGLD
jgi:predicted Zn-dependent protease with MMP-like domain